MRGAPGIVAQRIRLDESWRAILLTPVLISAALIGGLVAGRAAMGIQRGLLVLPLVVIVPVVFWRWPPAGPLLLLGTATLIEQWSYMVGPRHGAFTDRIPFFRTFSHGTVVLPAEAIVMIALLVWVIKGALEPTVFLPRSSLSKALALFWALLLVAFGLGISHGGKFNFALWEMRSWMFLTVAYLLTASLVSTRALLHAVMWVLVLGSGLKATQGVVIFLSFARRQRPRPDAILGHEEAFFFGLFIMVTIGLWLYDQRGRLRVTATLLLPFVVIADMANARRTAWVILFACLAMMLVAAWMGLPNRRRLLAAVAVILAVVSAVYFPLYWHHNGTLAQPARAVRSAVAPDPRDQSSDLYRKEENANLILNIRMSSKLGRGLGIPIAYVLPIVDISNIDPMITYIPHNGLLWVWMRMGLQGEIALWLVIGASIIRACQLARAPDRQLALFGALIACAVIAFTIQGYEDLGFAAFRVTIAFGCLLGCLEAAHRLVPRPEEAAGLAVGSHPEARAVAARAHYGAGTTTSASDPDSRRQ